MTKKMREIVAALCLPVPFVLANAGERLGFIAVPQFILRWRRFDYEERFPPSMNSNNLLAVVLENENDAASQDCLSPLLKLRFDCSGGSSDDQGSLKMIRTLRRWVPIATTIFMVVTPAPERENDAGR